MQVTPSSDLIYPGDRQATQPRQELDKDAFLKILVNQLRYQNPLSPQDSDSFITQMVQLTTMEQITKLAANMEKMFEAQEFNRAVSLIGHEVVVLNEGDETIKGTVEKVSMVDGEPRLVIGAHEYELSRLVSISKPVPEEPATEAAPGTNTGDTQEV